MSSFYLNQNIPETILDGIFSQEDLVDCSESKGRFHFICLHKKDSTPEKGLTGCEILHPFSTDSVKTFPETNIMEPSL